MEFPRVWVVLTTYNRLELAKRTLEGILNYLIWPNVGFILCDDGSDAPEYVG